MMKLATIAVFAMLAACSAELDNGDTAEANVVETLSVNNLVIVGPDAATAVAERGPQAPPPAQPPQTERPATSSGAARPTVAEPKQQTIRKPSNEAAAKPPSKPQPAPTADTGTETEVLAGGCTAEHRELGHC